MKTITSNTQSHANTATQIHLGGLIPSVGFVRLSTILKVIPVSKTTWWLGVKTGRFPKSLKLSKNTTVWRAEDILEFIASNGGH